LQLLVSARGGLDVGLVVLWLGQARFEAALLLNECNLTLCSLRASNVVQTYDDGTTIERSSIEDGCSSIVLWHLGAPRLYTEKKTSQIGDMYEQPQDTKAHSTQHTASRLAAEHTHQAPRHGLASAESTHLLEPLIRFRDLARRGRCLSVRIGWTRDRGVAGHWSLVRLQREVNCQLGGARPDPRWGCELTAEMEVQGGEGWVDAHHTTAHVPRLGSDSRLQVQVLQVLRPPTGTNRQVPPTQKD
jgi:hypothetical protein